jgi:hypothetical protein
VPAALPAGRCTVTADPREELGRVVRDTWVAWAREQPDPKPSWLTGWNELDDGQREVDMRIGVAVVRAYFPEVESLHEVQRSTEDLRAFEREYRTRLLAYLEAQATALREGRMP